MYVELSDTGSHTFVSLYLYYQQVLFFFTSKDTFVKSMFSYDTQGGGGGTLMVLASWLVFFR